MSAQTFIEWTEQTWNPALGCSGVLPGCAHCYAEATAKRLQALGVSGYENGFALTLLPYSLKELLIRRKKTIYFVKTITNLFHEEIPDSFIRQEFDVTRRTPQNIFPVLTKRAERWKPSSKTTSRPIFESL